MGIIKELYADKLENRSEPLELSFADIPMTVAGYEKIKEWSVQNEKRMKRFLDAENIEAYAAMILGKWASADEILSASEEEIISDIREEFTGDDVIAVMQWWAKISGGARVSDFQKSR